MRYFLKYHLRRNNIKWLIHFYRIFDKKFINYRRKQLKFLTNFSTHFNKRQQHYAFFNLKTNKCYTLSTGVILAKLKNTLKFYKRTLKSIVTTIVFLKKFYIKWFKSIYIYYCKNFTYRQIWTFRKIISLINPNIYYFINKHSYQAYTFPAKRLKRRITRMLAKA